MSQTETLDYTVKPPNYFADERAEMAALVPSNVERILDVGCGNGGFGAALKRARPAEVWGIEMVPKVADIAAGKLDHVLRGTFTECRSQLPAEYFDCIAFNDVLEHMEDPYTALKQARQLLRKGGVIIASIPNVRYIDVVRNLVWQGRWDYQDWGVLDRTHLRFFTRQSIIDTFADCGYQIETIGGIYPKAGGPKFKILNLLFFGRLDDMRYQQFALRTRPQ